MTFEIPADVRDLALRLGAVAALSARTVVLSQTGRMRLNLTSNRWLAFTARQSISVTSCAFDWRARFLPFGLLTVIDALGEAGGRLDATALGVIPVMRTPPSAALARGELMRYLGELAYAPDAILHNPHLRWRVENPDTLRVSAGKGDGSAEVRLSLGSDGRIFAIYAADRPRSTTGTTLPTPWLGNFSDYRDCEGRWIPLSGRVGWQIDGVETAYWKGLVVQWHMR